MTTAVAHSWYMTVRHLRFLSRQPWLISISLVQPVIWLLLFGQLFKRIVEIPGFTGTNYITFLTPGVGDPGVPLLPALRLTDRPAAASSRGRPPAGGRDGAHEPGPRTGLVRCIPDAIRRSRRRCRPGGRRPVPGWSRRSWPGSRS